MTFLAPFFLVAAGLAAVVVVGLHFLVTRPPPLLAFPTTRFIPRSTIIVTSLAKRPQDLLLLLLRVLALLLIGAAFARPVLVPRHRDVARIILVDRGWSMASVVELQDSLRRLFQAGDRVVLLDSAVHEIPVMAAESIANIAPVASASSYSAGLITARRLAAILRLESDSVDLILLSPLGREGWDGATRALRSAWPGRIQLVPLASRRDTLTATGIALRARADDPMRSTLALLGGLVTTGERLRLVRDSLRAADSAWVTGGGAVVLWPAALDAAAAPDTVNAVIGKSGAVIHPFARGPAPGVGQVIVRWIDGAPAATERVIGAGCIRDVRIPVSPRGDFVLRADVLRLVNDLTGPCAAVAPVTALDSAERAFLSGGAQLASREQLAAPEDPESPLIPWLLGMAILLMLLELWVRKQPTSESSEQPA